jgi:hypothetical protein
MPENTIPFDELMEEVLKQLGNHGYMDSTLIIYSCKPVNGFAHIRISAGNVDVPRLRNIA